MSFSGAQTQTLASTAAPGNLTIAPGPNDTSGMLEISGTYTGLTFTLQKTSDGTNWYNVALLESDNLSLITGSASPASATAYTFVVDPGTTQLRVNVSALSTGSVSVRMGTGNFFTSRPVIPAVGSVAAMTPATGACMRTNAGSVAPGQTLKTFSGKQALSAGSPTTVNLYTVTTGKTFYITDIYLTHDGTAQLSDVQIQAAGVAIFHASVKGDTGPVEMAGIESQPQGTSGQAMTIVWPAQGTPPNALWFISGFEQ